MFVKEQNTLLPKMRIKRTCLLLPNSRHLYLPMKSSSMPVDEYLQNHNCIVDNAKILIGKGEQLIVASNDFDVDDDVELSYEYYNRDIIKREKILNICQREVGHTIPCQNDIIVSDNATTCHILALHSTSSSSHVDITKQPLSSLAHVDKQSCDEVSIRNMIQTHVKYHNHAQRIEMKIHIVGGFDDDDGCSRYISQFLIRLIAEIAQEQVAHLRMTLQSCLISSLNDTRGLPIGRGLAMNTTTGEAFLASVHSSALGPEIPLRCCRIFQPPSESKLSLIHTYGRKNNNISSSVIKILPFSYQPNLETIDFLLQLPDAVLLQYTSTSPHAEKKDFCQEFRAIVNYMKFNSCEDIFNDQCDVPFTLERKFNDYESNWVRT